MKTKITTLLILLALLLLPTGSVHAQSPDGDVFRLGQDYTLESDETLNGNLAVIGGNVDIQKDATVHGDSVLIGGNMQVDGLVDGSVVLIGGNLIISGKIDGDIVLMGGQALLTETAVVDGDVVTMGGQVEKEPGAEITGEVVNNAPPIDTPDVPDVPNVPNVPNIPDVPGTPEIVVNANPLWEVAGAFTRALAIAAIGMLLTLFLQPQLDRVADTITRQPLMAGSFGMLTAVVAPLAILIMIVTILLIPVAAIVALIVLPMAWLLGMVSIGQEIGERFTGAINQSWAPVLATGFGTFMLVLVGGLVDMIPCIGALISIVVSLVAVGSVAMTLFGTRSAPGAVAPPVEIPPAS